MLPVFVLVGIDSPDDCADSATSGSLSCGIEQYTEFSTRCSRTIEHKDCSRVKGVH
jgi:hypothetical protein